jgi:NAD/NADP transhydrogenase beta subunit
MNWKLIFALSLFGLAMAIGTVYFIPYKTEPYFWIVIFLVCAAAIGKYAPGKYFGHGFVLALVNSVWITGAHVLLADKYFATHPDELMRYAQLSGKLGNLQPQQIMLLLGPMSGVIFGVITGLLSVVAGLVFRKRRGDVSANEKYNG